MLSFPNTNNSIFLVKRSKPGNETITGKIEQHICLRQADSTVNALVVNWGTVNSGMEKKRPGKSCYVAMILRHFIPLQCARFLAHSP